MSSEAMRALAHEIADYAASSPNWKDRVTAFAEAIDAEWGRAKTLYYASARRIDAEEMDLARRAANELKEAKRREANRKHLEWLARQVESVRQTDPEFAGSAGDVLEHFVRRVGGDDSTVGV